MADADHLLQDPEFMALNPREMVEYLERLNLSDSPNQEGEKDETGGGEEKQEEGNSEEAAGEKQEGKNGETGGEKQEDGETDGEKQEEGKNGEAIFMLELIEGIERENMSRPDPIPAIIDLCSFVRTMIENNVPASICMLELTSYYNYIQQVQKQVDTIKKDLKVSVSDGKMDGESCTICRKKYRKNEKIGTLDCGHAFHEVCVKNRLVRKNECPLCKATGLKQLDCVTCQNIASSKYEQGLELV